MLWCVDLREALEAAGGDGPPPPASARVAALDYLPEAVALCLVLTSGELLLLPLHPERGAGGGGGAGRAGGRWQQYRQAPEVQEVGAVAGGLAAAAWSPDGELLALVTAGGGLGAGDGNGSETLMPLLLLMNKVKWRR